MNGYRKALFPIHIYQANIKENEKIKSLVFDKINNLYQNKTIPIPSGWKTDKVYTSFDLNDVNVEVFGEKNILQPYYHKYFEKFFDDDYEYFIPKMWFNCYVDGEYQEQHTHVCPNIFDIPSHFSCIHYLSYDPTRHEPVRFVDPCEKIKFSGLELNSHNYNSIYTPNIHEGDFIMFPPYLEHYVRKSQPTPDYPRITVSFNITMLRYGKEGLGLETNDENGN